MLTIPKIRAAAFAIRKHFSCNPYQLLRNHDGVPGTSVRMIRYEEDINPNTLDIYGKYSRIQKDFTRTNPNVSKETLEVNRYNFFNENNVKTEQRKASKYTYIDSSNIKATRDVNRDLTEETLKARNLSSIHKKLFKVIERIPNSQYLIQSNPGAYVYTRYKSFADLSVEQYYKPTFSKIYDKITERLVFWKTLWSNMKH